MGTFQIQHQSEKAGARRELLEHLSTIKLKTYTMRRTISVKWEDKPQSEKIFAKDIPDKGMLSNIYKELLKLNNKNINIPIEKWTKDWIDRHITNKGIQMENKHVKTMHTMCVIR